ncbi:hypothetical protein [uncultured Psychroserpens sp.]|uniref:hypothetical protein n=1 Tax=uncultured Psychroserpens sp. TaxID=255436 RepID=UPI002630FBDA|nr:hypothetical protein [uncultured Psychroserpens sp.]
MGGEGSMSSAIVSLKNNRSLLKKRRYKKAKGLLLSESQKQKVDIKKVCKAELDEIKHRIRIKAKEKAKRNLTLNITLTLIITLLCWFAIKLLDGN